MKINQYLIVTLLLTLFYNSVSAAIPVTYGVELRLKSIKEKRKLIDVEFEYINHNANGVSVLIPSLTDICNGIFSISLTDLDTKKQTSLRPCAHVVDLSYLQLEHLNTFYLRPNHAKSFVLSCRKDQFQPTPIYKNHSYSINVWLSMYVPIHSTLDTIYVPERMESDTLTFRSHYPTIQNDGTYYTINKYTSKDCKKTTFSFKNSETVLSYNHLRPCRDDSICKIISRVIHDLNYPTLQVSTSRNKINHEITTTVSFDRERHLITKIICNSDQVTGYSNKIISDMPHLIEAIIRYCDGDFPINSTNKAGSSMRFVIYYNFALAS